MAAIATITLNPAIDICTSVDQITSEHKLRCGPERRDPGGGGVNVARVISRLGGDVLALYPAGGPIGQHLEALMERERVPHRPTRIGGVTRECFTVIERSSGKEFRFVLPGPSISASELAQLRQSLAELSPSPRYVVCSGSLPPAVSADAYARLAATAKTLGSRVVVDASGACLEASLQAGVYLVKPSLRELQELTRSKLDDIPSIVAAAQRLVAAQQAEIVVVTMGAQGAVVIAQSEVWVAQAIAAPVVSSVGAGDSFLGAMVWALASGLNLVESFRHGMAAGAASLLAPGTHLCAANDVRRLLGAVEPRAYS